MYSVVYQRQLKLGLNDLQKNDLIPIIISKVAIATFCVIISRFPSYVFLNKHTVGHEQLY